MNEFLNQAFQFFLRAFENVWENFNMFIDYFQFEFFFNFVSFLSLLKKKFETAYEEIAMLKIFQLHFKCSLEDKLRTLKL